MNLLDEKITFACTFAYIVHDTLVFLWEVQQFQGNFMPYQTEVTNIFRKIIILFMLGCSEL